MFSEKYSSVREKENRLYTDEQVAQLPDIAVDHPHYKEWKVRKKSADKFIAYVKNKGNGLQVLEVGCGNGWLAAQIATVDSHSVTGIDVHTPEIEQAKRVFKDRLNLNFIDTDLRVGKLSDQKFDLILFAASIQYFPSLTEILVTATDHLGAEGEIHILDSPFYKLSKIPDAKQRTIEYYSSLGHPEMTDFYFHHNIEQLNRFEHRILYNPDTLMNKLMNPHPFPWILVKSEIPTGDKEY